MCLFVHILIKHIIFGETVPRRKLVSLKTKKGGKLFKEGNYIRAGTIQGNTVLQNYCFGTIYTRSLLLAFFGPGNFAHEPKTHQSSHIWSRKYICTYGHE